VPAQKRRRLNKKRVPLPRQRLAERGQQHTIRRAHPRPRYLAAEHQKLVPKQQDLQLLPLLRASEKQQ